MARRRPARLGWVRCTHGTDGGGSVRLPAAYCGVVGLKPSTGRIPRRRLGAGMGQIASDGVLARSVEDAAMMLGHMDQTAQGERAWDFLYGDLHIAFGEAALNDVRVAWTTTLGAETPCASAVLDAVRNAAEILRDTGAVVTDESPQILDPLEIFPTFSAVGAAANYGELCAGREDELADYTRGSLRRGASLSGIEVARAEAARAELSRQMDEFFERYDALVTPTSAITAHAHGARIEEIGGQPINPWTISIRYTPLANLIGAPAIALPGAADEHGLPTSVQIITRRGDEQTLLRCAAAYERAMPRVAVGPV